MKAIINGKIILEDTILDNRVLLFNDKIEDIVSPYEIPTEAEINDANG